MAKKHTITTEEEYKVIHGLFNPQSGKDMRTTYPELKSIKELAVLKPADLKFCWNMVFVFGALPNKRQAIAESIIEAYGNTLPIKDQESYKNYNYPEEIRLGIEKLKTFDLSTRLKARFILEKTMNDYVRILQTDVNSLLTTESKFDDLKKYVDITEKINDNMPKMIQTMEQNYSVSTEAYEEYSGMSVSILDEFHKRSKLEE